MRALGYQAVDLLVERLSDPSIPALRRAAPAEMAARVAGPPPDAARAFADVLAQLSDDVLPYMNRADHPRFFAFIPSCQTFPGALGDFIASALNVYVGSWMEAAGPSQIELTVLDWFKDWLGFPEDASGVLVSGGSAANMTALACAREALLGAMTDQVVAYVSDQAHSSLARAARLLGFRPDQLRVLPAGDDLRLHARTLAEAIEADVAAGRAPLFASVSGGATNTGAVDPLDSLADVCRAHGVWLHVDAAYGGFAVLTERGRSGLHGISRADSIALDPHKWLYQPMECGALLVREGALLRRAFEIVPDYLKDAEVEEGAVNFSDMGLQLTRGWRALKVWLSIQTFGLDAFRAAIERSLDLALLAQRVIEETPELELMSPAQLGIVCFRRRFDGDEDEVAALNAALVAQLEATGEALVSSTRLHGAYVIRLCALNHTSRAEDVERVLRWFATAPAPARPSRPPRERRASTIADSRASRNGKFAADTIRGLPLFEAVTREQAERISGFSRELVAAPGEAVVRRHQLERDFYVIVSGRASVDIDGDHVRDLYAGEFFGELAALDWGAGFGYARSATVTAVTDLRLLVLPPRELRELMRNAPAVAREVQAAARERLRRT
jgi:glutamate/tyrosine decarboxylase-like PLP-dependent enzyme/mannose-6-phosphate isomerase-like protein (cupin superfamily)